MCLVQKLLGVWLGIKIMADGKYALACQFLDLSLPYDTVSTNAVLQHQPG